MSSAAPVIVWLAQDLRLSDHPALTAAAKQGPVLPVCVLDDDGPGKWRMGGGSRWWLHGSLAALAADIEGRGGRLVLRRGKAAGVIPAIARESGARGVYFSRQCEPASAQAEAAIRRALDGQGIECRRFGGLLLHDPDRLRTKQGEPYRVFTPFWKALRAAQPEHEPLPVPRSLAFARNGIASDTLAEWRLLPTRPDWAEGLRQSWTPGEAAAKRRLTRFIEAALADYAERRDRPGEDGTARLSPHLHHGEISPRQCWAAVRHAVEAEGAGLERGAESFLRELAWREFCHHLLHQAPHLPDRPWREEFADFPWRRDQTALTAWQTGRTGYPLVDAGMRQLWRTGWMHNRVRLVTASFLIKHLLIPWQTGEAWFWDTLVDADLANNAANWQWVAGSGADAAPYFRVFNPILQSKKFDPGGDYIREFVPELAALKGEDIHQPWLASEEALEQAGVTLDETYPRPIAEHDMARARALKAFDQIRK